jgi:SAM-dependent methyltransferase
MMLGQRTEFRYGECAGCGCLTLLDVPGDLAPYYAGGYYSFAPVEPGLSRPAARLAKRARSEIALRGRPALIDRLVAAGHLPGLFRWTAGLGLTTRSSIVDVGSGGGQILQFFARQGFENLTGFDPYLPEEHVALGPVHLHRGALVDVAGGFRLVMVHHAFEHMASPQATLHRLAALLEAGGAILIRTPMADSYAWRHYGVDWVQLDAPRHLHVHTMRSIGLLAARAGLRVSRAFRDSGAIQLWGSELYRRDLPLSEHDKRLTEVFSAEELARFEARAGELNAAGTGDSACVILRAV